MADVENRSSVVQYCAFEGKASQPAAVREKRQLISIRLRSPLPGRNQPVEDLPEADVVGTDTAAVPDP